MQCAILPLRITGRKLFKKKCKKQISKGINVTMLGDMSTRLTSVDNNMKHQHDI